MEIRLLQRAGFEVTVIWSSKHLAMILYSDAATNDENCVIIPLTHVKLCAIFFP
jgi:hypothetical protein